MMITFMDTKPPESDEKVIVTDTTFDDVPVRLYIPRGQSDSLRRAVIYLHGGGWCVGGKGKQEDSVLLGWVLREECIKLLYCHRSYTGYHMA